MKQVLLAFAVIAALSACDKNDNIIDNLLTDDVDLKSTTESVVTTEAALEDVAEAAEFEVELFSATDGVVESIAAEDDLVSLKAGGNEMQNRWRNRYKGGVCPNILIETEEGGWPRTITLDYGDGTELANGRIIAGIIEIFQTAPRTENGAVRTVTFIDFNIDGIGIAGTIVKTFLVDELKVEIVRDLTFTLEDGTIIEHDAECTRTWVEGRNTPLDPADNVFAIEGFVNCEDSDGNIYRRTITKALMKRGNCRYIVAGEASLSKNGVAFATINYGDGTCDNVATMTTAQGRKQFRIGNCIREKRQSNEQNQNRNGQ